MPTAPRQPENEKYALWRSIGDLGLVRDLQPADVWFYDVFPRCDGVAVVAYQSDMGD